MSRKHGEQIVRSTAIHYGLEQSELSMSYFKMRAYGPKRQYGGSSHDMKRIADAA